MKQPVLRFQVISAHAIERYQERVDRTASVSHVRRAIAEIVGHGRRTPNPRHWMHDTRHEPGTSFVYWAQRPTICAVMRQGVVVTILTQQLVDHSSRRERYTQPKSRRSRFKTDFDDAAPFLADELHGEA